jgi:hypothetical protein
MKTSTEFTRAACLSGLIMFGGAFGSQPADAQESAYCLGYIERARRIIIDNQGPLELVIGEITRNKCTASPDTCLRLADTAGSIAASEDARLQSIQSLINTVGCSNTTKSP